MTITLDLRPETLAALRADAEAQGRSAEEVAAEHLAALYGDGEEAPDEETLAAIGRGFADLDAGRSLSLEEVRARSDAALAARFGKIGAGA